MSVNIKPFAHYASEKVNQTGTKVFDKMLKNVEPQKELYKGYEQSTRIIVKTINKVNGFFNKALDKFCDMLLKNFSI